MKMIILFKLSMIGALAVPLIPGSAIAESDRTYNGSYCNAHYGDQSNDFNKQYRGIRNVSSYYRCISCAVCISLT